MNVDVCMLRRKRRENYLSPYRRHAWEASGPGLTANYRCRKCGCWSTSRSAIGLCTVALLGPPVLSFGCLEYPGGLTVGAGPDEQG